MKLSRSRWIFIIAGVILIAAVGLGMSRSQQTEQINSLKARLAQGKQKLALVKNDDLIAQKNELALQIERYTARSESARNQLVSPEDSISATDILLESAAEYGLFVANISSPGFSANTIGGLKCTTLPLSVQIEGNVHDITNFICNLSLLFPTSVVKTLQLTTRVEPASASGLESAPDPEFIFDFNPQKNTSADISLIIYSYKGQ